MVSFRKELKGKKKVSVSSILHRSIPTDFLQPCGDSKDKGAVKVLVILENNIELNSKQNR